jgi:hypothetical protein
MTGESYFYTASLTVIGKHFLNEVLPIEVFKSDLNDIIDCYKRESERQDETLDEETFFEDIVKRYLYYEKAPCDVMLGLYREVSADLKLIDANLEFLGDEKLRVNQLKTAGTDSASDRYYLKQLDYYRTKNLSAKDEIVRFVTDGINDYALHLCRRKLGFGSGFGDLFFNGKMPYKFSRSNSPMGYMYTYDVRKKSEIFNYFHDVDIPTHKRICDAFKNDPDEFWAFAKAYISGEALENRSVKNRIESMIQDSPVLCRRRDAMQSVFDYYEQGDLFAYVSILPLQIEGIFYDICKIIGIDKSKLSTASINKKLDLLNEALGREFYSFEYFAFKFPVIRNHVAHGHLIESDLEHISIMLTLDLLCVCELATSSSLAINKKIKFMQRMPVEAEELFEFIPHLDVKIPENCLYKSSEAPLAAIYKGTKFWSWVEDEFLRIDEVLEKSFLEKLKQLISNNYAPNECKVFLKSLKVLKQKKAEKRQELLSLFNRQ